VSRYRSSTYGASAYIPLPIVCANVRISYRRNGTPSISTSSAERRLAGNPMVGAAFERRRKDLEKDEKKLSASMVNHRLHWIAHEPKTTRFQKLDRKPFNADGKSS